MQKIFKFSQDKTTLEEKQRYEKIKYYKAKITNIQEKIKDADHQIYAEDDEKQQDTRTPMFKSQRYGMDSVNPIQLQKKKNLQNELRTYINDLAKLNPEKESSIKLDKETRYQKEKFIRVNLLTDVFSSKYTFQNPYLNPDFYTRNIQDRTSKIDKDKAAQLEKDTSYMEHEVLPFIEQQLSAELDKIPLELIGIENPLLKEADIQVIYDKAVETERLAEITNVKDDFAVMFTEDTLDQEEDQYQNINEEPVSKEDPFPFPQEHTHIGIISRWVNLKQNK